MKRTKTVDLNERATALIRREMAKRGVSYSELAERLGSNRKAVTTKIARGNFVTPWFLAALDALGVKSLRLDD
jgi:ribosome-binding protein aMBF1 (putative translation factor)